jgi:hypothetical protein
MLNLPPDMSDSPFSNHFSRIATSNFFVGAIDKGLKPKTYEGPESVRWLEDSTAARDAWASCLEFPQETDVWLDDVKG